MTEAEWIACTDPAPMLEFLADKASVRKHRLFAAACCRRVWGLLKDERSRIVITVAESFADGQATVHELQIALEQAIQAINEARPPFFGDSKGEKLWNFMHAAANTARSELSDIISAALNAPTHGKAGRLRDIFGNPFRPVAFDSAWRTANVTAIAATIYAERQFADLPILADALEEAGCTSADLLGHCRQPGEHVRGCWVVDLILEKS